HGGLNIRTIHDLGTEEQREQYLPKMNTLEYISSFCLTEPEYGSDASNLQTSALEVGEDIIINGTKRWIGNCLQAQILIVWARNTKTKQVQGYIVETDRPGVEIKKIEGKLSTTSVENCDIIFKNVK